MHFPRFFIGLALLAIGCGGSTASSNGTGAAGGSGGSGNAGNTGGSGNTGNTGGSGNTGNYGGTGAVGGGSGGGTGTCTVSSDCPAQGVCGFAISDACNATGQCFPPPGAVCEAYSPGCACDGTEISVVCTGLPDGYTEKPLAHPGSCSVDFACGDSLTCNSANQYCKVATGGPCCSPPSYSCEPIPAACAGDYSCQCIQTAVSAQECDETGGGVTVTFLYP